MAILTDLEDPRVRDVTVTGVEVAADMRQAKVYVSVMGNEAKQNLSLRGLQNAAGYLQSKIAQRIDSRYTPKLQFVLDKGVKKQIEIAQILGRVLHEGAPSEAADRPELLDPPDQPPHSAGDLDQQQSDESSADGGEKPE